MNKSSYDNIATSDVVSRSEWGGMVEGGAEKPDPSLIHVGRMAVEGAAGIARGCVIPPARSKMSTGRALH